MEYIMMFQDIEVAKLWLDDSKSAAQLVYQMEPINERYFPFSIQFAPDVYKLEEASAWLKKRMIPTHRKNIKYIQSELDGTPLSWTLRSHAASTQDSFWLKKPGEDIAWSQVTFFGRAFDYSIGNLTFGITSPDYIFDTPDLTTGGLMPKTWRIRNDKLYLLKHGTAPDYQEPFNEKAATDILSRICPVPFVKYELANIKNIIVSICENFMEPDYELVSAGELFRTENKPGYLTTIMHLKERCRAFEIPNYKPFLDNLFVIDYIIGNTDRNLGNFGFIYDVANHTFLGPAPIYDNGTAFLDTDFSLTDQEICIKEKQHAKAVINDTSRHFNPNLYPLNDISQILQTNFNGVYEPDMIQYITERITLRVEMAEHYLSRHRHRSLEQSR